MYRNSISRIAWLSLLVMALSAYTANTQDSLNVTKIGQLNISPGVAFELAVSLPYAYVADFDACLLRVMNVSNPSSPIQVGSYNAPDSAMDVALSGSYVYVADHSAGLRVVDISNPVSPVGIGHFNTVGFANGVAISGSYAFVTDVSIGLWIVDITNPTVPVGISYVYFPGALGVAVSESFAFIVGGLDGMLVVDVSTPATPIIVGSLDTPGVASDIVVSGNHAYVADGDVGACVLDIANPYNPLIVSLINTPGNANGVAISGVYLYVADGTAGMRVVNISNPGAPFDVGYYNTPGNCNGLTVSGYFTYIADGPYFSIYQYIPPLSVEVNISPINPPILIPANGGYFRYNLNVHNLIAIPQTFQLWNRYRLPNGTLSNPVLGPLTRTLPGNANPTRTFTQNVAATSPPGAYLYISYVGTYPSIVSDSSFFVFVKSAATDGGPFVDKWNCSGDFLFGDEVTPMETNNSSLTISSSPNPFNPSTMLTFTLPHPARVTLELFDINGRNVGAHCVRPAGGGGALQGARSAPLQEVWYEAGTHTIPFDGSGLPSGVYLARLTAGEYTGVQKLVLLK